MEAILSMIPLWLQLLWVGVLGLVIGSFLNVVLYRLRTGRSLNGSSHCMSCLTRLRWFELVPVVSYLALRGRCRSCSSVITSRYALVEFGTGLLFVALYSSFLPTDLESLLGTCVVLLIGTLLTIIFWYDIRHMIILDQLVILLCVASGLFLLYTKADSMEVIYGALIVSGSYGFLWLVSRGRWIGFGDVKLAVPLGGLLGTMGAFSLLVLSFWIGALVSIGLLGYQWGKSRYHTSSAKFTMKSEIPFAPFIIAAFLVVFTLGVDVLSFSLYIW